MESCQLLRRRWKNLNGGQPLNTCRCYVYASLLISSDVERSLLQMYGMSMGLDEDQMEIVEVLLTTHILF